MSDKPPDLFEQRRRENPSHPLVGMRGKCPECGAHVSIQRGEVRDEFAASLGFHATRMDDLLLHEKPFCNWFRVTPEEEIVEVMMKARLLS